MELSAGWITLAIGLLGTALAWLWIYRITRGEPEPEANDGFWWSRTAPVAWGSALVPRRRAPTRGWLITRSALWSADLAIVFLAVLPLVIPTSFGPTWEPLSSFFGVSSSLVSYVLGLGLAIGGRLWMERILRTGREPEAHDEFWWSRT